MLDAVPVEDVIPRLQALYDPNDEDDHHQGTNQSVSKHGCLLSFNELVMRDSLKWGVEFYSGPVNWTPSVQLRTQPTSFKVLCLNHIERHQELIGAALRTFVSAPTS
jgi:hypothetical protein